MPTGSGSGSGSGTGSAANNILWVHENPRSRRCSIGRETTKYYRSYQVKTNDPLVGADEVSEADDGTTAIPGMWDAHPDEPLAYVESIDPRDNEDDATIWDVDVTYSTLAANETATGDPLAEDPVIKWGSIEYTRVLEKDRDG